MILVTGAAGFIGSHLVERLLKEGYPVLGIDNFDPFYDRSIKEANLAAARGSDAFSFAEGDIRDSDAIGNAIDQAGQPIEAIVNLAALAGVRPSLADPIRYHDVNVLGTTRLLELAREREIKQFVCASSSSVYGVNRRVPWREDDRDLQPISPYASSKLSCEMVGHVFNHLHGIRFLGLRFFTVFGPRQRPDLAIAKFVRLIRAGEPIPVFGDGSTRRDYTYVDDIVDGIIRSIRYTDTDYELINLGNHNTVSLTEMIDAVSEAIGIEPKISRQPLQPGDVPQTWADISTAQKLLGWSPTTSLKEGLAKYTAWLASTGQG